MIEKNQDYNVDIVDLGFEGEGITKINGFTMFVKGALKGEKAKIKVLKVNKDYGFAKLLEVLEESIDREEPVCENFKKCGGCNLQHMNYETQLNHKTNIVKTTLKKALGYEVKVNNIVGMGIPYHYRNKAQYPVVNNKIGFYKDRSHDLIENEDCCIQNKLSDKLARIAFKILQKHKITSYDEKTGKGVLRHIVTRIGVNTGETMLMLVTNGKELKDKEKIVNEIKEEYPEITTIVQNINETRGNVILGRECITLYGEGYIVDRLGDFKFKISPLSFYQVNPVQTEILYNIALNYAELTGEETVFDLYSGTGTIAQMMAPAAKKVIGIEIIEEAVVAARENAKLNGLDNCEFIAGDVLKAIDLVEDKPDLIILDPPRDGINPKALEKILAFGVEEMVYISCKPSSLARDLKVMTDRGYKVKKLCAVDQFPMTTHCESICLLSKKQQ